MQSAFRLRQALAAPTREARLAALGLLPFAAAGKAAAALDARVVALGEKVAAEELEGEVPQLALGIALALYRAEIATGGSR